MPNENLTEIVLIADRSGSMHTIRSDAEGGINSFIEEQKKVPGEATLTLVQFDTHYEVIHENRPIADVPPYVLEPGGGTALLDAIGKTINAHKTRVDNTPEENRPGKIIYVIVTDGEENSSQNYNKSQINELITGRRDSDGWEFIFLAANQDAIQEAHAMGISGAGAMNFAASAKGVERSYFIGTQAVSNMRGAASGQSLSSCLNDMALPENAEGEEAAEWINKYSNTTTDAANDDDVKPSTTDSKSS
jgi:uncharacterized protein YegL